MFNRFLKINTCGEQRWINVDRVTRVSLATEHCGMTVLVFCFDGAEKVIVHGDSEDNLALIQQLIQSLDQIVESTASEFTMPLHIAKSA